MIVHLHAFCWNEEKMLPFFFRHYDSIIDQYFIYDDESTDGSVALLEQHPKVELESKSLSKGDSVCLQGFQHVNQIWRKSCEVADWVVVCNIDELFDHKDMRQYLAACSKEGITFIAAKGFQMVTEQFPDPLCNLCQQFRWGVPFADMNKPAFFNPNAITDSGFGIGRHRAHPQGEVIFPKSVEVRLLHYKYLGLSYVLERHKELFCRMREGDRKNRWGFQYDRETTEKEYQSLLNHQISVPQGCNFSPLQTTERPFFWEEKKERKSRLHFIKKLICR